MPHETPPASPEAVVLASFTSRRAAEHMVASLGREFRKPARKGHATAFVISGNKDGSLKVTESRVLSSADFIAAVSRIALSLAIGFMAIFSTLKGARGGAREARKRQGHAGTDDQRTDEILAEAGPGAALALFRCDDDELWHMVTSRATEQASAYWDGSLAEFHAKLDPGPQQDWVRRALGEPFSPTK